MVSQSGTTGQPSPSQDAENPPGKESLKKLGKYEIQKKIGAGGMGAVYLAVDTLLRRTVALKILPRDKAQNPILRRRFAAEAHAAASLKHENIVTVYEAGEIDGLFYIALEYIEGTDVADLVQRRGVIPVKRSIDMIRQVLRGLNHAFSNGIVHRDIKPANLMVRRDGVVKLADLGLARSVDDEADTGITRAGTTVGTVDYMSPEQARDSKAADIRSDLYSLGCTWYYMLTGGVPFPEGSMTNKLRSHAETPAPDPRLKNPNVSEAVVAVIQRMMAKDPISRYQTPTELLKDLQAVNLSRDAVSSDVLSELAREQEQAAESPVPSAASVARKEAREAREAKKARDAAEQAASRRAAAREAKAARKGAEPAQPEPAEQSSDSAELPSEPAGRRSEPAEAPRPRRSHREEDLQSDDESTERDYTFLLLGGLAGAVVLLILGFGWLIRNFSSATDSQAPTVNPFANRQAAGGDTSGPILPGQVNTGEGLATAETVLQENSEANATGNDASEESGSARRQSRSRRQTEAKWLPGWARSWPSQAGLATFRVGPGAGEGRQFATLKEALEAVPDQGAAITLNGPGPFPLDPLELRGRQRIVLQAGERDASSSPTITLRSGAAGKHALLRLVETSLELRGVQVAVAGPLPSGLPAIIEISEGDFLADRCSLSIPNPPATGLAAILVHDPEAASNTGTPSPARVLIRNSLVRGNRITAVRIAARQAAVLLQESLLLCGEAPVLDWHESSGKDTRGDWVVISSTLYGRHALRLASNVGETGRLSVAMVNSILAAPLNSRDSSALLIEAPDAGQIRSQLKAAIDWKAAGNAFRGWKSLIGSSKSGVPLASTAHEWNELLQPRHVGVADHFQPDAWPATAVDKLATAKPAAFSPETLQPTVKALGGGLPGCPTDELLTGEIPSAKAVFQGQAPFPGKIFDPFTDGRTIRIDVTKQDLATALEHEKLTTGTTIVVTGSGARTSGPIVIRDAWVRMKFEPAEGPPLVLSPRPLDPAHQGKGGADDAFLSVINGGLEVTGGSFSIPASEKLPYPHWLIRAQDSDLALRSCSIQGPMVGKPRTKGGIQWIRAGRTPARPFTGPLEAYCVIQDSFLTGLGHLIEADLRHRGLFVRNSVLASREDIFTIRLTGTDPQIAGTLELQRSTFSAAGSVFDITAAELTGPTTTPLRVVVDRCVFGRPIDPGERRGPPSLVRYRGPLLEQNQLAWQEQSTGYAREIDRFLVSADEKSPAAQKFEQVWLTRWGKNVVSPLHEIGNVLFQGELPHRSKLEPGSFTLLANCRAAKFDQGKPIGADVNSVGAKPVDGGGKKAGKSTPVPGF